ncbi:MAG: SAM-dependent methyltransferase [Lachnospiraceae bacterium]|nr:SAM-dependent methyltransferase [Lachnospiraceae bacterium]
MKQKSIKNIRQEFKDNGIFYTPEALALKLKSYVDIEPESVYDPTCGAGNLLRVFPDSVKKYGQELDAEQLVLIDIPNFTGYAGDTLADDKFAGIQFDCIVANPPFSIKWNPDELKEDPRFCDCPALPPPSKADWAFMLHILHHLSDNGVAVVLEFPGILYRGQREYKVRRWFIENNYVDRVVNIPGNTFEDTSISTCIIVLKKKRQTTDVTFEDGERSVCVSQQDIADQGYTLSVNTYLPEEVAKEEIDINALNKSIVTTLLEQVEAIFSTTEKLQEIFDDNFYLVDLWKGLRSILEKYRPKEITK